MNWLEAILLGVIQGLTEFLPISSTAHLEVIPVLCGIPEPGAAFTAVIQWGTWLASVIYFRHDVVRLTAGFFRGLRSGRPWVDPDSRMAWLIILGTIPIVVCGMVFQKAIKNELRSLYVVAAAAIGLAVVLAVAEWLAHRRQAAGQAGKGLEKVGLFESLVVGFSQALALIPGASRSGVTITGSLFAGLDRSTAARFSFLLSLPAIFGAGLYSLYKDRDALLHSTETTTNLVIATVVSAVVGYAAIAYLIRFLRTHTTWVFIIYRIALGLVLLGLLASGTLQDVPTDRERNLVEKSAPATTPPAHPSR